MRDANEGQERCTLPKCPLIITHIHTYARVGIGVLNTPHGQRTREISKPTRCRRAYHPRLLIWHGPRVGLLAIDEKCSSCEAVCFGVAYPSTSTTSPIESLRSRACSKCCALAMTRHRGRSAGCKAGRMRTNPSDRRERVVSESESRGLFYVKCTVQLTTTTAHEHTHIYAWHARRKPVGAEPIFSGRELRCMRFASNI